VSRIVHKRNVSGFLCDKDDGYNFLIDDMSVDWQDITCTDCIKKSVAGMARKRAIELRNERLEAEEFIKELKAL